MAIYFNVTIKREGKLEVRAYIKARFALHIAPNCIFSELCRIHRSSAVTLRTVLRWVKKVQRGQCRLKDGNYPERPVVSAKKRKTLKP